MKKLLEQHLNFMEASLKKKLSADKKKVLLDFNRTQIGFFQHERLIHLLITLFFAFMFLFSVFGSLLFIGSDLALGFSLVALFALILLIFYIIHYFFLENGVQKLYLFDKKLSQFS